MRKLFEEFFDDIDIETLSSEADALTMDVDYRFTMFYQWRDRFGQKEENLIESAKHYNILVK